MKVLAHAKLNLNLSVIGKREDGFHDISSVMTSISIADRVEVRLKRVPDVNVTMNNCPDISLEENTAYTTACKFFEYFNIGDLGAEIKIQKNIPLMAGLGGSSADSAGVLYCLASLCSMVPYSAKMFDLASKCGSDTLAMLLGGCVYMEGRGEIVTKLPVGLPMVFVVAVGERCHTKKVFDTYDSMEAPEGGFSTTQLIKALRANFLDVFQEYDLNDLTEACCEAYPAQKAFIQRCTDLVGQKPVMSGSGGSVFWPIASEYVAIRLVKKLRQNGITAFLCSPTQSGIVQL